MGVTKRASTSTVRSRAREIHCELRLTGNPEEFSGPCPSGDDVEYNSSKDNVYDAGHEYRREDLPATGVSGYVLRESWRMLRVWTAIRGPWLPPR
jgi:hypothetical protein